MDFGSLLGALSTEAGGIAKGVQTRQDRERQARQQMIENALRQQAEQGLQAYRASEIDKNRALTTKYQQPTPPKAATATPSFQPIVNPVTGAVNTFDRRTGTMSPTGNVGTMRMPRAAAGSRASTAGGAGNIVNQETRAAAQTMREAARQAASLEQADAANAIMPSSAAAMQGISRLPVVGGALSGVTESAAQRQMTPGQQRYQAAADLFTHNYVATLPKSRVSPQLIAQIKATFFPRPGQTDPAVIRQFREKRDQASDRLWRAINGESVNVSDLPGYEGGVATPAPTRRNSILDRP